MALRIFISHASVDTAFAQRLATDLRRAGADVWLDATHLAGPGDFVARISKALNERDVLVLILSPSALTSQWVPLEMNAAIVRSNQGYMRPPLVVQQGHVSPRDIPGLWTVYQRIDATASYEGALPRITQALGVKWPPKQDAPQAPATTPPATTPPNVTYPPKPVAKPAPQPGTPAVTSPDEATASTVPKVSRRNLLISASAFAATAAGIGIIVKLANTNQPVPNKNKPIPGTLRWRFQTGAWVRSSPAVANGLVYIGSNDGYIYALGATTGTQHWRFQTGEGVESSPAVANGLVYIGSVDHYVYALEATKPIMRWRFQTDFAVGSSRAAVANGLVYVSSWDHSVYALEATTGTQRWRFQTGNEVNSTPAVANDLVYVGSSDGHLYALEATTGTQRWRFQTGAGVISSPTVANGLVYIGSDDHSVYAVNA